MQYPTIGILHGDFKEKFGIPRQPNLVNSISYIEMYSPYDDLQAFQGIETFSHLWLLWHFHANKRTNDAKDFRPLIRPPRLGGNQKIGVFASRSMYRPAPIGLSVVKFLQLKQEHGQTRLYLQGGDLLDGTPILDIKPYIHYSDAIDEAKSGYATEKPALLSVEWEQFAWTQRQCLLQNQSSNTETLACLTQILAQNPQPAYQHDPQRLYGLSYANLNVKFRIGQRTISIVDIQII